MYPDPQQIKGCLSAGKFVADADFDRFLPEEHQRVSYRFWTPVGVSLRVTRWLSGAGAARVLDVGSGVGKFCVVGALASGMSFTGIEQRPHLVRAADELAQRFGVSSRVNFVNGCLEAVDFRDFDALYFYNPFGENRFAVADQLDDSVEVTRRRFDRDVAEAEYLLERMPVGTRLATFNSFGGRVPDTYELVRAQLAGINVLRFWQKTQHAQAGGYWLELDDATLLRGPGRHELLIAPQEEEDEV